MCDLARVEVAEVEFGQIEIVEHTTHINHVLRVETTQVETGEAAALSEHTRHKCNLASIEVAQVDVGKATTAPEHAIHVIHVLGI